MHFAVTVTEDTFDAALEKRPGGTHFTREP